MDDTFVYLVSLPAKINEVVTPCIDGYTIYISDSLSRDDQLKAYSHALYHINHNDFDDDNVQLIESNAHNNK